MEINRCTVGPIGGALLPKVANQISKDRFGLVHRRPVLIASTPLRLTVPCITTLCPVSHPGWRRSISNPHLAGFTSDPFLTNLGVIS
jgi:hypothetical protein